MLYQEVTAGSLMYVAAGPFFVIVNLREDINKRILKEGDASI